MQHRHSSEFSQPEFKLTGEEIAEWRKILSEAGVDTNSIEAFISKKYAMPELSKLIAETFDRYLQRYRLLRTKDKIVGRRQVLILKKRFAEVLRKIFENNNKQAKLDIAAIENQKGQKLSQEEILNIQAQNFGPVFKMLMGDMGIPERNYPDRKLAIEEEPETGDFFYNMILQNLKKQ
jgi:hypothetical protein